VIPEELTHMRDALAHRGPDSDGLFVSDDGAVGLGFRRLRIIDLTPNGNQPMANEDGSIQLVFNGEIYNYRTLRDQLESRHQFRSQTDTETIVHLYEEKGLDAIAELEGMFALALWDGRRRRLVLARDRAGKKPLFFMRTPRHFVFASEIKSFFRHSALTLEPNMDALPSFFIHGYVPSPNTLYRGVYQIEPGSWMTVDEEGTADSRPYWQLRFPTKAESKRTPAPTFRDAAVRVRELVDQAVAKRLMSDVPIGALLSGGVDSTVIVGLMSRHMAAPVKTFSIGFDGDAAYDETSYARIAAEQFGTDHTEFRVSPSAIDLVEQLVWHHDGPFGDASAIPSFIVSRLTREHVTVALSGDGGDELFAGYSRFAAGVAAERIPRAVRRLLAASLSGVHLAASDRHLVTKAQRFTKAMSLPLHQRMTRWSALFYDDLEELFSPEAKAALSPINRLSYLASELPALEGRSTLAQILHANYRSYLLDDLLVKADRCSMANSLEIRSPFLDRDLTEYVVGLPDHFKLSGWKTKRVLREAFRDLLPPAINARSKMGFGVPLNTWFRGALQPYLQEMLLARDARYGAYLSQSFVERLIKAHQSGAAHLGLQLWTLLTFEIWLRLLPEWTKRPSHALSTT
jgi:asparagine synthase (glutamine-hydrolysing)